MSDTYRLLLLWAIPAAPLFAAILLAFTGKLFWKDRSHRPCVAALGVSTVAALLLLLDAVPSGFASEHQSTPFASVVFNWLTIGDLSIPFELRADAMTALMLIMVTFVSLLVAVFAIGYMHGDPGYPRFFAAVSLFVFSMCMLVLAGNFLLLFVFWEAVGLCSYLLIGFWFQKPSAAAAAKKAFVVNRIGDFGFILGVFLIWTTFGSLSFDDVLGNPKHIADVAAANSPLILTICLLLFLGAMGKSAQFPLHVWLPDAMEGPTPVSALIHAATMVTAGVYMVARCTPLFVAAPAAQLAVSSIGAATALIAAITALTQYDLKRVMAYSTVSQLGYMFMALGAAAAGPNVATIAVTAAMFHLFSHAFFKALLFLGSGSVMHAMGNVIDMRRFSGLKHALPITHMTFLCGAAALAGLPPLAGFFSKDEILGVLAEASHESPYPTAYTIILIVALVTAFLTAFYTFRAYFMTFHGEEKYPEEAGHHPHDAPPVMAGPLYVLAGFAVAVGLVEFVLHLYSSYLHHTPGLPAAGEHRIHWGLMGLSMLLAFAGTGLAWQMYVKSPALAAQAQKVSGPLYGLSQGKFFFDEVFNWLVVIPIRLFAQACIAFDKYIIDRSVDVFGQIPRLVSWAFRPFQNGSVQAYALTMLVGVVACLWFVIRVMAG